MILRSCRTLIPGMLARLRSKKQNNATIKSFDDIDSGSSLSAVLRVLLSCDAALVNMKQLPTSTGPRCFPLVKDWHVLSRSVSKA